MATQLYGVFPHAEDGRPTGRGYVVHDDGYAQDRRNYRGIRPLKVYKVRAAAERDADRRGGY